MKSFPSTNKKVFQHFHNLSNLSIKACRDVTTEGVSLLLKNCPNLISLSLEDLPQIEAEKIQQFRTTYPNVFIYTSGE
jgi:hypothetical protein